MAQLRWVRAALLAVVSTTTASLAHVGADGLLPGLAELAGLLFALVVGCVALLRTSPSAARVVLLLVAGQSAVHLALTGLAGHRPAASAVAHHEHGHAAATEGLSHVTAGLTGPEAPMVLAHLVAAALVGAWLAYGEAAVFAVVGLAASRIRTALRIAAPLVAVPLLKAVRLELPAGRLHSVFAARALGRRGPPQHALVTA